MTEPEEAALIQQHFHLTDEEMQMHADFTRGQALLCAGRNRLGVDIIASERELELITTDPRDIERIRERQELEKLRENHTGLEAMDYDEYDKEQEYNC